MSIKRAIQSGTHFLSIYSIQRSSRDATYSNEELNVAIEEFRKRPIDSGWLIPIRIDDAEIEDRPIGGGMSVMDLHVCDFRDFDKGAKSLLRSMGVHSPSAIDKESEILDWNDFVAPGGTPHAAIEALEGIQSEFGTKMVSRRALSSKYGKATINDLSTLKLLVMDGRGKVALEEPMEDVALVTCPPKLPSV